MKRILVTGFDPFGGETVNPAREAVMRLPEQAGEGVPSMELHTVVEALTAMIGVLK